MNVHFAVFFIYCICSTYSSLLLRQPVSQISADISCPNVSFEFFNNLPCFDLEILALIARELKIARLNGYNIDKSLVYLVRTGIENLNGNRNNIFGIDCSKTEEETRYPQLPAKTGWSNLNMNSNENRNYNLNSNTNDNINNNQKPIIAIRPDIFQPDYKITASGTTPFIPQQTEGNKIIRLPFELSKDDLGFERNSNSNSNININNNKNDNFNFNQGSDSGAVPVELQKVTMPPFTGTGNNMGPGAEDSIHGIIPADILKITSSATEIPNINHNVNINSNKNENINLNQGPINAPAVTGYNLDPFPTKIVENTKSPFDSPLSLNSGGVTTNLNSNINKNTNININEKPTLPDSGSNGPTKVGIGDSHPNILLNIVPKLQGEISPKPQNPSVTNVNSNINKNTNINVNQVPVSSSANTSPNIASPDGFPTFTEPQIEMDSIKPQPINSGSISTNSNVNKNTNININQNPLNSPTDTGLNFVPTVPDMSKITSPFGTAQAPVSEILPTASNTNINKNENINTNGGPPNVLVNTKFPNTNGKNGNVDDAIIKFLQMLPSILQNPSQVGTDTQIVKENPTNYKIDNNNQNTNINKNINVQKNFNLPITVPEQKNSNSKSDELLKYLIKFLQNHDQHNQNGPITSVAVPNVSDMIKDYNINKNYNHNFNENHNQNFNENSNNNNNDIQMRPGYQIGADDQIEIGLRNKPKCSKDFISHLLEYYVHQKNIIHMDLDAMLKSFVQELAQSSSTNGNSFVLLLKNILSKQSCPISELLLDVLAGKQIG